MRFFRKREKKTDADLGPISDVEERTVVEISAHNSSGNEDTPLVIALREGQHVSGGAKLYL